MDDLDRRTILVGSGLALALGACSGQKAEGNEASPGASRGLDPKLGMRSVDPNQNVGDKPWLPNPNPRASFDPAYTCLLYINVEDDPLSIDFLRVHFPAVKGAGGSNEWADNQDLVCRWINFLNGTPMPAPPLRHSAAAEAAAVPAVSPTPAPTTSPTPMSSGSQFPGAPSDHGYFAGIRGFACNQPHHFVVYVRNNGTRYHQYPIVFTGLLNNGLSLADLNHSFYSAKAYNVGAAISGNWSKNLVYCKNFYQSKPGTDYGDIQSGERRVYALNVNTECLSNDGTHVVLVIDPDAGNMGEGQP